MPDGDPIAPGATFRRSAPGTATTRTGPRCRPTWTAAPRPTLTYHRFWAQADIAMAFAVYGELFGGGGGGGTDTQPPSAPTGLKATGTTSTSATLSWTASTDNVGVSGYLVLRDGTQVGTSLTTTYSDSGLAPSTAYTYTVEARDAAGNTSAPSGSVTATTAAAGTGGGSCTAAYTVDNDWGNGFTATVTVTNNGSAATSSWQVTWSWPNDQQISNAWNATVTQSGAAVSAQSVSFDSVIAPGSSTTFGFQASYSAGNTAPTLHCTSA